MNEEQDQQAIRTVIDTWLAASAEGDLAALGLLMDDDVVFLLPGRPPMRGREAFLEAHAGGGRVKIGGWPDVQEIHISGDFAYCWNQLRIELTPLPEGEPSYYSGPVLSVFRRLPDNRWVLYRDANLLTPES